ncbi:MAG: CRISPR-associated protein [Symploca sp. SIO2G7]|nr:CRISPR-associated protein [Symploca sp. SIO2G7]
MHKRFVNHCTIELTLAPCGPILIKSGKEGADPTKPDMEFVETYHAGGRSVYLPGSSLKGAIRAHAERIVRTVGRDRKPDNANILWANDPLKDQYDYLKDKSAYDIYRLSSFTDQMFGNTAIASRIRIEDAYPDKSQSLKIEERNGVAIDRVFCSVAVGPFNYQVCTAGAFKTKIHLKNFSLAQLGLIGLVLRDLDEGWFGLGFAKSRGLGMVEVTLNSAVVQYPGCILDEDNRQICSFGKQGKLPQPDTSLLGVGMFLEEEERQRYNFPVDDVKTTPIRGESMALGFGVQLRWQENEQVQDLFTRAVDSWSKKLTGAAA